LQIAQIAVALAQYREMAAQPLPDGKMAGAAAVAPLLMMEGSVVEWQPLVLDDFGAKCGALRRAVQFVRMVLLSGGVVRTHSREPN
jgi:hypothetical protein